MTAVDPVFAQWLQERALFHLEGDATLAARWGDRAQTSERVTPLALQGDAEDEAQRQIAFLGGPLVEDEHLLVGEWRAMLGRTITLEGLELGYFDGSPTLSGLLLTLGGEELTLTLGGGGAAACFVIGAQDDLATGLSRVTVLRRL